MATNADAPEPHITTEGGAYVEGNVVVDHSGTFVGRDLVGYTAEQVSALIAQIRTQFQPKPFDGKCPYVGLEPFTEADADRFFGREALVKELVERVSASRSVVIAGPSGSGKSSLVRAGLIHALKGGALEHSDRWIYESLKPGRDPIQELVRVASSISGSLTAGDDIRTRGLTDPTILHRWADIALKDDRTRRVVIFVDQFEEIFTQTAQESVRVAFLNLLTTAATVEDGRVTVLFALRSDFVSNCAAYPELNRLVSRQFIQVGAMAPDELVSAIARPALEVGLQIDPDLIAQIMDDMQGEPGTLPLMQFALKDLFDTEQAKGGPIALTRAGYLARGGLRKALERHADLEFATLTPTEQQLARAIFAGLVEIGNGNVETARTALMQELVPAHADPAAVANVVEKLADARLVTVDVPKQQATPQVMLAHERLIDAWPWLHQLVVENRDRIALQNQIAQDAREWAEHGREPSYLYTGARLATARESLAANQLTLSELAQSYVDAAIATADAARRRRQRVIQGVIGGLTALTVVLALLTWLALTGQQRAVAEQKLSRSRELAALALSQAVDFPERALLIALEANRSGDVTRTFESEDALRQTLLAWRGRAILRGHTAPVNSAQFSPDGQHVVTASDDGTARVWDRNAREILQIRGHAGAVAFAQFSPDNRRIVTAGADGTARVWDAATGAPQLILKAEGPIRRARFSDDGKLIVTASEDNTARVWDAATGVERARLTRTNKVNDAQFSPRAQAVLVAVSDNRAYLWAWSTTDLTSLGTLAGAQGALYGAAISPDFQFDATIGADRAVRVYRTDDPQRVPRTLTGHTAEGYSVTFSPDGKYLLTASRDQTARIWEVASGREVARLVGHADQVTDAAYSPDGRLIVTAGRDRVAILWDAGVGRSEDELQGHTDAVTQAHFSPDGKKVVTASADNTARIWDAGQGTGLWTLENKGAVTDAQFSADGQRVVTASTDKTARVWNASTGQLVSTLTHDDWVWSAEFSPDNKLVLTASDDRTARVWNVEGGAPRAQVDGGAKLSAAHFSPDGSRFLTVGADFAVRVWESATGKSVAVMTGHSNAINTAQFSPDGKRVVTASDDGTARVWDAATGKELVAYRGHANRVLTAAFSHDGKSVVSGSVDQTARVWDASNGQERANMTGHLRAINEVSFSPDDRQIVTASDDGTVRLWDAATGSALGILHGHTDRVYAAEFSPDGTRVVTASQDGTARIHYLSLGTLMTQAEQRILRDPPQLTCDERRQFLQESVVCPTPTPAR